MVNGILGRKIGMTQVFNENGTVDAVTVIEAGPCVVTQVRSIKRDGYEAVQLGFGNSNRLNKPEKGHLKKNGEFRYLREFEAENISEVKVGQQVDVSIFEAGDLVDISGTSKGKGFAGAVKRHHFAGGPKTHGQSDRHRAPGSIGATTTPGKVFKGLRMAGHMGAEKVTVQRLTVVSADPERNLLLIKGGVPGASKGLLMIKKTVKA